MKHAVILSAAKDFSASDDRSSQVKDPSASPQGDKLSPI